MTENGELIAEPCLDSK